MAYQDADPGVDRDGGPSAVAHGQTRAMVRTASDAGSDVAQTAKDQVRDVVGEAKRQGRDLVGEAGTQVRRRAGVQKDRVVQGLLVLGEELEVMAEQSHERGIGARTARRLSERTLELAQHVDVHEPTDLLDQAQSYARQRPVVFLAGAAVAGVVAGRLTRGLASSDTSLDQET